MKIKGYTLIEILIVLALFLSISGIVAGILYSTLRITSKTKITNSVTQNGNFALSAMTDIITSSDKIVEINGYDYSGFDCSVANPTPVPTYPPKPSGTRIGLRRIDGGYTDIYCDSSTGAIASGSAQTAADLLTSSPNYNACSSPPCVINLIDPNEVIFSSCTIQCIQNDPYSFPHLEIQFSLQDKAGGTFENKSSADFRTSVSLRNYNSR